MGGRPRAGQNTSELGRGGCACWAEGSSPRPASRSWKRGTIGRRAGEEAALTLGGKGGESGVVPGQRGGVRVLRAGQRVVVPREGGRGAQHAVGQLRAQVGAVGRGAHGHPVQGVGAAREGKVHPPVHQVLCGDRAGSLPQARPQTPEPRGAGCRSPGNSGGYLPTYLPGPPGIKTPSLPLPTRAEAPGGVHGPTNPRRLLEHRSPGLAGGPHGPDLRRGLAAPAVGPALGRAHTPALGSPGSGVTGQGSLAAVGSGWSRGGCGWGRAGHLPPRWRPACPHRPHRRRRLPGARSRRSAGCRRTGAG